MPLRDESLTWSQLAALLRACGLPRRTDDTKAAMAARLADANLPPGPRQPSSLAVVPALQVEAQALDALADLIARAGGRRLGRRLAV